ncbi:site-specific integrase [Hymenobacter tenuis]
MALVRQYESWGLATCLPYVQKNEDYLPHLARLAGIGRLHITTRVGRKTFATLKIYQGVLKSQVMLATGHQTEKSFNRYSGINEQELLEIYRRTVRTGA